MSTESTIYTEYPDSFACLTVSSAPSFAEKPPIWMSHLAPLSAFAAGLAGAGVVTFFLGGSSLLVFTVCTGFFTVVTAGCTGFADGVVFTFFLGVTVTSSSRSSSIKASSAGVCLPSGMAMTSSLGIL